MQGACPNSGARLDLGVGRAGAPPVCTCLLLIPLCVCLFPGSDKEKEWIATQLAGDVVRFSLEVYGCRVIQRALESLSLPAQLRLVAELKDHVITCVEDQHGNLGHICISQRVRSASKTRTVVWGKSYARRQRECYFTAVATLGEGLRFFPTRRSREAAQLHGGHLALHPLR